MNVQNTFNKVIKSGLYAEKQLMCHALKHCARNGLIEKEEYIFSITEIKNYLKGFGSLAAALDNRNLPWDFESRLKIYKDWENKPSLEKLQ